MRWIIRSIKKEQPWIKHFWNMRSYWPKGISVQFKNKHLFYKCEVKPAGVAEVVARSNRWATPQAKPTKIKTTSIRPRFRLLLKVKENHNNRDQVKNWSQPRRDVEVKAAWGVQSLKPLIWKRCQEMFHHIRIAWAWRPFIMRNQYHRMKMIW